MKKISLVPPIEEAPDRSEKRPGGLTMPKAFTRAAQRNAWSDLIDSSEASVQTPDNRFTFEMAAILLAKFRSGRAMNATETKELKRNLITLGLAKDEHAEGPKKSKNASKYFGAA